MIQAVLFWLVISFPFYRKEFIVEPVQVGFLKINPNYTKFANLLCEALPKEDIKLCLSKAISPNKVL